MFKFPELFGLLKEQLGKTFLLVGLLPALLLIFGHLWVEQHDATCTSKIIEDFSKPEGIGTRATYWILSSLVLSLTVPGLLRWLMDTPDRWGVGARRKARVNLRSGKAKRASGQLDALTCTEEIGEKGNISFFLARCFAELRLAVAPLCTLSAVAEEASAAKKEPGRLRKLLRMYGGLETLQTRAWAESGRQQGIASFLPETPRAFHVGNLAAKLEEYAIPRYGIDSTTLWPRLAVGLKPEEEQRLSGPKLRATACLSVVVVCMILFCIMVGREALQVFADRHMVGLLIVDWREVFFLTLLAASTIMCWSGMTLGVRNLVTETRTLIDLRWYTLFGSLGFERPESFWRAKLAMRGIKDFLTDGDNHLDPSRLAPLAPEIRLSRSEPNEAHSGPGLEQYQVVVYGKQPFKTTTVHLCTTVGHFLPEATDDGDGKRTRGLEIEMDAISWTSPETDPPSDWIGHASFCLDMMGAHSGGVITANWQGAQSRISIPPATTTLDVTTVPGPKASPENQPCDGVTAADVPEYSHTWVQLTGSSSYPIASGEAVRMTISKRREYAGTTAVLTNDLQVHLVRAADRRSWTLLAQLPIPDGPGPTWLKAEWAGAIAVRTVSGIGDPLSLNLIDASAAPESPDRTLIITLKAGERFHGSANIWIKGGTLARAPAGGGAATVPLRKWTREEGEPWTTELELRVFRENTKNPLVLEVEIGTFRTHLVCPGSSAESGGQ